MSRTVAWVMVHKKMAPKQLDTSSPLHGRKIGFIGTGAMNGAIIRSLLNTNHVDASMIYAFDPNTEFLGKVCQETGIHPCSSNNDIISKTNIVVLGTKPQQLASVLLESAKALSEKKDDVLLVSIAAGYKMTTIQEQLESIANQHKIPLSAFFKRVRVARVMPNICCTVGEAASAFVLGKTNHISLEQLVLEQDRQCVQTIFSSIGQCVSLTDESYLDCVTGLSGSGPAYAFMFIEALADGGVYSGLPRETAILLAAQTVLGAAKMVISEKVSPGVLKDRVMSPAGTTARGVRALGKLLFVIFRSSLRNRKRRIQRNGDECCDCWPREKCRIGKTFQVIKQYFEILKLLLY